MKKFLLVVAGLMFFTSWMLFLAAFPPQLCPSLIEQVRIVLWQSYYMEHDAWINTACTTAILTGSSAIFFRELTR